LIPNLSRRYEKAKGLLPHDETLRERRVAAQFGWQTRSG